MMFITRGHSIEVSDWAQKSTAIESTAIDSTHCLPGRVILNERDSQRETVGTELPVAAFTSRDGIGRRGMLPQGRNFPPYYSIRTISALTC
jgi:hypothetical protein